MSFCFMLLLLVFQVPAQEGGERVLDVRIVDAGGQPIAGAEVSVVRAYQDAPQRNSELATDDQGRLRVPVVTEDLRAVVLQATAEGFVDTRMSWSTRGEDAPLVFPDAATMTMPGMVTIGGVVIDTSGRPVPGAKVWVIVRNYDTIWDHGTSTVFEQVMLTTNEVGRWKWDAAPAPLADFKTGVRVGHPDGTPSDQTYSGRPTHEALLAGSAESVLRPKRTPVMLTGRVLDADGQAIEGASLRSFGYGQSGNGETDAEGRFSLWPPRDRRRPDQEAGSTRVLVLANGYAPQVEVVGSDGPHEVRLEKVRGLPGRVVDREGNPLAGVRISCFHPETSQSVAAGSSDASGAFVWPDPLPGMHVTFRHEGHVHDIRTVTEQPTEPVLVTLRKTIRLRGRVTDADSGEPLSQFTVALRNPKMPTHRFRQVSGSDGAYRYRVESPALEVCFEAPGYVPVFIPVPAEQEGAVELDVQLHRPRPMGGRVVDAAGGPVAGAVVFAAPADPTDRYRTANFLLRWPADKQARAGETQLVRRTTDSAGGFELKTTTRLGRALVAHDGGYAVLDPNGADWPQSGAPTAITLQPFARIHGCVPLVEGRPLVETVTFRAHTSQQTPPVFYWRSDGEVRADGTYSLDTVLPYEGELCGHVEGVTRFSDYLDLSVAATGIEYVLPSTVRPVRGQVRIPQADETAKEPNRPVRIQAMASVTLSPMRPEPPLDVALRGRTETRRWSLARFADRPDWLKRHGGVRYHAQLPGRPIRSSGLRDDAYASWGGPTDQFACGHDTERLEYVFPGVPPGRYVLTVECRGKRVQHEVTVPPSADGAAPTEVVLPPLDLRPVKRSAWDGQAAPALRAKTMDGSDFDLAAFRGGLVLVYVWSPGDDLNVWYFEALKRLNAMYGEHPSFAVVSLVRSDDADAASAEVRRHGLTWPQIRIDGASPLAETWGALPAATLLQVRQGQVSGVLETGRLDSVGMQLGMLDGFYLLRPADENRGKLLPFFTELQKAQFHQERAATRTP